MDDVAIKEDRIAADDLAVAGSLKSQKVITRMGLGLGVVWLLMSLAVLLHLVSGEAVEAYRLGSEKSSLWVQLMLYPFVNYGLGGLLVNLVWLAGLVRVARRHMIPASLIRVYSLGTVGVGLIYWMLSHYVVGGQRSLTGSYLALFTLQGALAVMAPDEILFPGWGRKGFGQPTPSWRGMLIFAYLVCALIDMRRGFGFSSSFVMIQGVGILIPTAIVLSLMGRVRLGRWVFLLLLSDLWFGVWLKLYEQVNQSIHIDFSYFLLYSLTEGAALTLGLLYGWAEKMYARHEDRLRAA